MARGCAIKPHGNRGAHGSSKPGDTLSEERVQDTTLVEYGQVFRKRPT
jgi:hypothetical protein